jgi:hypothetical protein
MGSEQFRDYVTGTSFCLTLSRRMIEMISQMDAYGSTYGLMATARGLSERGLVEWADKEKYEGDSLPVMFRFRLTEAGKAVVPLLKLSGLYVEYPALEPAVELPPIVVRMKDPQP